VEPIVVAQDDAFYIREGEMTFTFGEREVAPLNIHAPAGLDRRIGLPE
jgi:hypothetical protein